MKQSKENADFKHTLNKQATWTREELFVLLEDTPKSNPFIVNSIDVGDIFFCGALRHFAIVLGWEDSVYTCVTITSTVEDTFVLTTLNTKFGNMNVTKTLTFVGRDTIIKNYVATLPKYQIIQLREELKEFYKKLIK
jgi:hypothetical protein|tara:strand:+ start:396 stop:806 length:411 start_codon:yes stop_codon:yes gene_type:complete